MFRSLIVTALVAASVVFIPAVATPQPDKVVSKTGQLAGKETTFRTMAKPARVELPEMFGVGEIIPIRLKQGDSLVISLTVEGGKKRRAAVMLLGPDGKVIDGQVSDTPTAQVKIDKIAAPGPHKIVVFSDAVGGYTLHTGPSEEALADAELEIEIKELKAKLEKLEAERDRRKKDKK